MKMKKTKRSLAIVIAIFMILAVVLPVFAAGEGSITIDNSISGQTYKAYRIFDLESYSGTNFSYKVNSTWQAFIADSTKGGKYVDVDTDGYVTWKTNADAAEFAKEAMDYATTNSIAATATQAATGTTTTFSQLDLGYYLVNSTVGTLCELTTTKPTITISDKNAGPTITNKSEVSNNNYNAVNTETIGTSVPCKAEVTTKEGAENYELVATIDSGLTYEGVTAVKLDGNTVDSSNYTVTPTSNGFKVTFNQSFLDTLADDQNLEVDYSVKLNENATIAGVGNTSSVVLNYGANKNLNSAPSVATIYTYEFDVVKTDESNKVITGASFELYDAQTSGNKIGVVLVSGTTYRVAVTGETPVAISAGTATIQGLGNGTYYLEETAAPTGYNQLSARQSVTISNANNKATVTGTGENATYTSGGVQIINKTGTELPTTGGIGTTIIYIVGGTLMVGAAVILIAKKRASNSKE